MPGFHQPYRKPVVYLTETHDDILRIRSSVDGIAVAGVSEVEQQGRPGDHGVHVPGEVPPSMQPSALPLDGTEELFLHVIGAGNDDRSGPLSQRVTEQEAPVFIKVRHDNRCRPFGGLPSPGFAQEGNPELLQDGPVVLRTQRAGRAPVVPPALPALRALCRHPDYAAKFERTLDNPTRSGKIHGIIR